MIYKVDRIFYSNATRNDLIKLNRGRKEPKYSDLKNVVAFLNDFGIQIEISDIPKFKTVKQLLNFRYDLLKSYMRNN